MRIHKQLLIYLCLLFLAQNLLAQSLTPEWIAQKGGSTFMTNVNVRQSVTDASGNTYTVGNFTNTVDFDPGSGVTNLTAIGGLPFGDIFIQKINNDGSLAWVRQIGGGFSRLANALTLDASNNVWITGRFGGTVDFDPGAGIANLSSGAGDNTFVLKLDNGGLFLWAGRFWGSTNEGLGIASNGSDIFITGYFQNTTNFNPASSAVIPVTPPILNSTGGTDIFVVRLNNFGTYQNVVRDGGSLNDEGRSITVDASGAVLVTGFFQQNSTNFGISAGGEDIFVWQLNPFTLGTLWGRRIGSTSNERAWSITSDDSSNPHITGFFSGTVDFDPGVGTANLSSAGETDIFVLKLNSSGNYVWAKNMGGIGNEEGLSIKVALGGNVYTTGYFSNTADFDPNAGTQNLTSAGGEDIFVSCLSSSGDYVYAKAIGGVNAQRANSINLANGRIYLSGIFEGATDFDPQTAVQSLSPIGFRDGFVARFVECPENVSFTPAALPGAAYNVPYTQTITQTGLGGTLTWSIVAGALPPGFTFTPTSSDCTISGTTTDFGVANFTIQVSNGDCNYTQNYQIFYSQMAFNEITGSPFATNTNNTRSMTIGDFNKDGITDLVYARGALFPPFQVEIKLGAEEGTFTSLPISYSVTNLPKALSSFDVNDDGFLDVVSVNTNFTISYLNGTATSPYLSNTQIGLSLGTPALTNGGNQVILADMDNDGYMDIVTVGTYNASPNHYISLRVLPFDNSNNLFLPPIVADTLIFGAAPADLFLDVADIDNDGFLDVVVASGQAGMHPIWFRNIGGTAFNQYYSVLPATTYAGGMKDIKTGDFNNDGRKDIAILANNGTSDVFRMYINNGGVLSNRFNPPTGIEAVSPALTEFRQMVVADFDNDRDLDIAVSAFRAGSGGRFAIIRNEPLGNFYLDTYENPTSNNVYAIATGDFNRDGLADVAIQDINLSNNLRVFLNTTVPVIAPRLGNFALRLRSANNETGETNEAVITTNTNFTVEGWVKLQEHTNDQYIFYNGDFGTNGFGLYVPTGTRELHIISYQAGVPTDISARAYPSGEDFVDSTWNHFALGRKATGDWFFFWNGNNDSLALPAPPTHNFTAASDLNKTFFGWNGVSAIMLLNDASIDEFRFWKTALTQTEVQEWMNLKANKNHPQATNIAAHYDFNTSPVVNAFDAFDESEKIYPPVKKKNAIFNLVNPATLDENWTQNIPPVANFGSSRSIYVDGSNQASVLDYDPQTGIQVQFNSTVFPTGTLVVTRALEYPTDAPNPNGVPKVYWTIRNYGTPKVFDPLEMLRIRLTQLQCDSARPSAIPLPTIDNYTTFYLAKRSSNSNNPADWQIIGPPQAFGTLQFRRPGSVISDFSQVAIIHSLDPLALRLVDFSGKRDNFSTNILEWKAYFRSGEQGFILEKSFDASNFFTIHQQSVLFNNGKALEYKFRDNDAFGAAYYRLRMTDSDGKEHYSKVIFIDKTFLEQFSIYPNPTRQGQELSISIEDDNLSLEEVAQLSINNLQGIVVWEQKGTLKEIENSLNADLNKFTQGFYIIKVQIKQRIYTTKWIKD